MYFCFFVCQSLITCFFGTEQKGPCKPDIIIFPVGNSWVHKIQRMKKIQKETQNEPPLLDTDSDTPEKFSKNEKINRLVHSLQTRILMGENGLQVEIDSLIGVELITRNAKVFEKLEILTNGKTIESFRSPIQETFQIDNLPDLGYFIRKIVLCSGNNQDTQSFNNTLLNYVIYESMPQIKRTKLSKNNTFTDEQDANNVLYSACINVIAGTMLGVYEHAAKRPGFSQRCTIIAFLREKHCLDAHEKYAWLKSIINILRICFIEYVMWFISSFMPSEMAIIQNNPYTTQYIKTYVPICDCFRQDVCQTTTLALDFSELDKQAIIHIERCIRACKFKMHRNKLTANVVPINTRLLDEEVLVEVMATPSIKRAHRRLLKTKGRATQYNDFIQELQIMNPDSKTYTIQAVNQLHQCLAFSFLPANVKQEQQAFLDVKYKNCEQLKNMAQSIHICITCCMNDKSYKTTKFRYCTQNEVLQCVICKNDWSTRKINLLGMVLYYCRQAMYLCTMCCSLCTYEGDAKGLIRQCNTCKYKEIVKRRRPIKTSCFRCTSKNVNSTMNLLDTTSMRMQKVFLCHKHTPQVGIREHIRTIEELIA